MKKSVFLLAISIIFFHCYFIDSSGIAYAYGVQSGWQTMCNDFSGKTITFVARGQSYPDYCHTDGNGYRYWQVAGDLDYTPSATLSYVATSGWNVWALIKADAIPSSFLYFDESTYHFLGGQTIVNTFTMDGISYSLVRWNALGYSPIHQIDVYSIYGGMYFFIYTDQDLSYIDTQAEAYAYMDSIGAPPNTSSRFENILPTTGTTTPTTSVNFSFDYYYNSSEYPFQKVGLMIFPQSGNATSTMILMQTDIVPNALTHFATTTTLQSNTAYTWQANFFGSGGASAPLNMSVPYWLYVVSNPFPSAIGIENPQQAWGLATSTCGITNISGCFQNALVWAFVPKQENLARFGAIKDMLLLKPPLGYWTLVSNAYNSLTSTGTPAFQLATSSAVVDTIFNPLKTGIAIVLWLMWGGWLIKTISHFTI